MTGKERILSTISHKEPDRIPIDLGSTHATSINIKAYESLLSYIGVSKREVKTNGDYGIIGQLAKVDEDVLEHFSIDTRGIWARLIFSEGGLKEDDNGSYFKDEWGIIWYMPLNGFYYDMISHPLIDSTMDDLKKYKWPSGADIRRFSGFDDEIREMDTDNYAIILGNTVGNGFLQTGTWLEGYEDFLCDLALESPKVEYIMDKILEIKIEFWDTILEKWGDKLDIIQEHDDYGAQDSLLISPEVYKKYIKPRQKILFKYIKKKAPHIKIFFHSDGSIKPLIPDLIEVGVDILNPIQISAVGMDPELLKKEFGNDLTFWGGGIDTQNTLSQGSIEDVKNEVKRRIEQLGEGSGYVFATVHNIQSEVPPKNLIAMWETVFKYGIY